MLYWLYSAVHSDDKSARLILKELARQTLRRNNLLVTGRSVPARFTSGAYDPEVAKMMGDALDQAWAEFEPKPRDAELARSLMATAIIERLEGGEGELEALVRGATIALMSAIKADPDHLRQH